MSETELEALYYDPLCRRVVDVPAEAALAKPPTITFAEEDEGHEEIIRSVEKYLEEEPMLKLMGIEFDLSIHRRGPEAPAHLRRGRPLHGV